MAVLRSYLTIHTPLVWAFGEVMKGGFRCTNGSNCRYVETNLRQIRMFYLARHEACTNLSFGVSQISHVSAWSTLNYKRPDWSKHHNIALDLALRHRPDSTYLDSSSWEVDDWNQDYGIFHEQKNNADRNQAKLRRRGLSQSRTYATWNTGFST